MNLAIRQRGMSLIELMVAVLIALIGILIITQAYILSDNFNRSTVGESGSQTNGLLALYAIERDVRNAGYGIADTSALGCGEVSWYRTPNYSQNINAASPLPRIHLAPVRIVTASGVPDEISIVTAGASERMIPGSIRNFTSASNLIEVETKAGFSVNDFVVLVNDTGCTMVQITNIQADPSNRLEANTGTYNPTGWGSFPVASYGIGNLLFNLGQAPTLRTFSVANGKLLVGDALTIAGGGSAIELMDGIVDLRAEYGKDNGVDNGTVASATFAANDGQVDQFSTTTPANSAEWQQVLSVRVGVLARIGEYEKPPASGVCEATTTAPTWAGGAFSAVDIATPTSQDRCYRYRVFETTIPLRNMIWRAS